MKNYDESYLAVTAAAEISNQLRKSRVQAKIECNNQGFKLTRISKDNTKLYARFMLRNNICKIRIVNTDQETILTYNLP